MFLGGVEKLLHEFPWLAIVASTNEASNEASVRLSADEWWSKARTSAGSPPTGVSGRRFLARTAAATPAIEALRRPPLHGRAARHPPPSSDAGLLPHPPPSTPENGVLKRGVYE